MKVEKRKIQDLEKENILKEYEEMKKKLKKMDSIIERLNELEENHKDLEDKVLGDIDEEKLENLKELL